MDTHVHVGTHTHVCAHSHTRAALAARPEAQPGARRRPRESEAAPLSARVRGAPGAGPVGPGPGRQLHGEGAGGLAGKDGARLCCGGFSSSEQSPRTGPSPRPVRPSRVWVAGLRGGALGIRSPWGPQWLAPPRQEELKHFEVKIEKHNHYQKQLEISHQKLKHVERLGDQEHVSRNRERYAQLEEKTKELGYKVGPAPRAQRAAPGPAPCPRVPGFQV